MRSAVFYLVCTFALAYTARTAVAGPAEDLAREHTKAATAAFNLGHYDEAVVEYEAAYKAVQDPALLFNIGQANRLGGHPEKAIVAYRSYLRTAPDDAPNRELVEKHIEQLEAATWTPGPAPQPEPTPVASHTKDLTLKPEPPPPPATDLSVSAPAASEPKPSAPLYKRWWLWTAVGAAVVGGVITAVLLSRGQEDPIKGNVNPPVVVVR